VPREASHDFLRRPVRGPVGVDLWAQGSNHRVTVPAEIFTPSSVRLRWVYLCLRRSTSMCSTTDRAVWVGKRAGRWTALAGR